MNAKLVKYNRNTDISKSSANPINQFLAGQLSPQTKRAYYTDIRLFFEFAGITQRNFNSINFSTINISSILSTVIRYRDSISRIQEGTSFIVNASTVARKMTSIKMFFEFLVKTKVISYNPVSYVKSPSVPSDSTSEGLTVSELKAIFLLIDDSVIGLRDKAILNLMFHCALRRTEVATLKFDNIKTVGEYTIIRFIGKRNKVREIPLKPELIEHLKKYLTATNRNLDSQGFLFLSHSHRNEGHQNIKAETIYYLVKKYIDKSGINKRISPHSFRHSSITAALDNNASYRDVMNLTGHSDSRLVKRYDRGDKLKNNATWKLPTVN